MRIVALDSSSLVASVAILEDDNLIGEYTVNYKRTHSETLLPMLDELFRMLQIDKKSIDAFAIAAGPGSFTGLRIGSATVKGLARALDKPIIPVPTLEGLAYNLCGYQNLICPIMDARRGETYTGIYEFNKNDISVIMDQTAMPMEALIDKLNILEREVIFLGDGVPVFSKMISESLKAPYMLAPANSNRQRAGSVGVAALHYARMGKMENACSHAPIYLRKPQAERERENA